MARINLLPWREEFRQEKKKEFFTQMAGVCILAALVAYVWVMKVDGVIAYQNERNNILNNEIKLLSEQVKEIQELKKRRRELSDRMKVIQDLQGTRPLIVRYFDEFAKAVPDGIYVTSVKRVANGLTIEGVSEANSRVSTFMRRLNASKFFDEPDLKTVDAEPALGEQAAKFTMQLKMVLPSEAEEEG